MAACRRIAKRPPLLALASLFSLIASAVGGCADPDSAIGFDEPSPAARIRAVHQAASSGDKQSIKPLIQMLDSDDPAQRLLAIRTLEKMTGQTLGYDHAASKADRDAAVQRWTVWYAQHSTSPTQGDSRTGTVPSAAHPSSEKGS